LEIKKSAITTDERIINKKRKKSIILQPEIFLLAIYRHVDSPILEQAATTGFDLA
jgi:hypothetical protein